MKQENCMTRRNPNRVLAENLLWAALVSGAFVSSAQEAFSLPGGSDGSDGELVVEEDTALDLPEDGIFNFTTITINSGASLTFNRNARNTPVYLLANGDVVVEGSIDLEGESGSPSRGGKGGPGGFDGGHPGFPEAGLLPGHGHGPGGGPASETVRGAGIFAEKLEAVENQGEVYGSPLLLNLIGGSGSSGTDNSGGGGGGGAILIASNTRIIFAGFIFLRGANSYNATSVADYGSGGGVRLVAPVVDLRNPTISAHGRSATSLGRIRVDSLDTIGRFSPNTTGVYSSGANMFVFLDPKPELSLLEVAGEDVSAAVGPVDIVLGAGSSSTQKVVVAAENFNAVVPVEVVLTPDYGPRVVVTGEIDNTSENPAQVEFDVEFPTDQRVTVDAWVR